jgi:hypothetical protein
VLIAGVFVEGNASAGAEAKQGSGRASFAIAVESVDIDAFLKRFPR